jgi:hypothetical protein
MAAPGDVGLPSMLLLRVLGGTIGRTDASCLLFIRDTFLEGEAWPGDATLRTEGRSEEKSEDTSVLREEGG